MTQLRQHSCQVSLHLRKLGEALGDVFIRRDVVAHFAVVELLVGDHVEVARAGEAEHYVLCLSRFLALEGFVNCRADGVAGFRSREDAFGLGEELGGFEHLGLLDGRCTNHLLVVEFRKDGAHAVVAQAASMVGRRDEAGTQRVHLGERADLAGIAEVVGVLTASEARAACRFHSENIVVGFATELFADERAHEATEVRTTAGATDDEVGFHAELVEGGLRFETDDGLVEEHLIQHGTENVAVTRLLYSGFHSFGDGAAEATRGAREFGVDLLADVGRHGRGRGHGGAVGAHDFAAERFLFVGNLHHIDLAVNAEECRGHREGGTPLAGTRFGGHALEALLLGVIGLSDGGVELVGARGVVAFKLVVDVSRSAESLFEEVGADQRRRTVHLVERENVFGNFEEAGVVVQFLLDEFVAEHGLQVFEGHRLAGTGVQERSGFLLHVGTDVVPCLREFVFVEVSLDRAIEFERVSHFIFLSLL